MKKFFVLVALAATVIPATFVIHEVGGWQNWQGVLPKGTTDSLYYYARIKEVVDGHPLNGNPYVYEYQDTFAPAFFLPDIISALPMLLGVSFNIGVLINVFVWSLMFLMLAFFLFKLLKMPEKWTALWSVMLFVSAYSFVLRPTIMQIIYPVFFLFLMALLKFLHEPFVRRRVVYLSLASAGTFYIYTYLSYIVVLTLASVFLWYLVTKRFKELKALVSVGLSSTLLLIPFSLYTLMQIESPYYFETFSRIGLMSTRIPAIEAFFYGRWVVLGMLLAWLVPLKQKVFWFSIGVALLLGLFLNVITGVELQLSIHIGRFVILWMAIILGVALYEFYYSITFKNNKAKYMAIAVLLLMLSVGVARSIYRGLDFFKFNNRGDKIADLQPYASPLEWLNEYVSEQSVIWANESVSQYIPIMTRHYPLFFHGAMLHNISTQELEDRYLLSRSMNTVVSEDLKRDFSLYSGKLPLQDEEYFKQMLERFDAIKTNQATLLEQFNVKYLIIDRTRDDVPIYLPEPLYDDGRFVILPLPF